MAIFFADVQRNSSKPNIREMGEFYEAARTGRLPTFTFIEPRISPNPDAKHLPSTCLPTTNTRPHLFERASGG